ncbi:hypothetical protein RclHR1_00610015 [Rhizophagus clarus]|uniref:Kinase-like domain-containing protein n=1 Tax=Rhizophagus clarus TaxID=94130 RepID=A0A2Z6RWD3_9GLOM|nr:hypothetical protein RclHR1_00610015 [Rhizophagus clarus]GES75971.1 kinase-like domain-containing protein [Rhizophagus clarus]
MDNYVIPLDVKVPYPIELTVEEILNRRTNEKLWSRAPNNFFIYRIAYLKELKKMIGSNFSMITLSSYISTSWSKESPEVKEAYKRLSDQVENRLKEIRQNNALLIIHEKYSSPLPPPTYSVTSNEPIFFYPYFGYYYYDNYNNCYYLF